MQDVAGGSKRSESGDRTTGAFGVGFISVYQVTDRPEIHSSGRRWIIRPEDEEGKPIHQYRDPSLTRNKGTVFRLPWAFQDSQVRRELKVSPVSNDSTGSFIDELKDSLPNAILFLKKLEAIKLSQNGNIVSQLKREAEGKDILVTRDGTPQLWQVFEGEFDDKALELITRYPTIGDSNRCAHVRVAIPDPLIDDGLLFATLPTEQSIGLPFHVDADFFPASDRKSILFYDSYDPESEWNRAAMRAAASVLAANLIRLLDIFKRDAPSFWEILSRLSTIHREPKHDERMPLGAFWESLEPLLVDAPIVYTESIQWLKPAETRIPTGAKEWEAVSAFEALGIEIVHQGLRKYHNILTSNGVAQLKVKDIYEALRKRDLIERPQTAPPEFKTHALLKPLWQGIHGILENTQGRDATQNAEELLRECVLAPGMDGCLWPLGSVYRADDATRKIFANLISSDMSFLDVEGIPLLKKLCPQFTVDEAIRVLERQDSRKFQSQWKSGGFRPRELLHWFDEKKSKLTEALRERLADLPIFPSAEKLRPLKDLHLPGGFDDPIGVADLANMGQLEGLSDFLGYLGAGKLTFPDYALNHVPRAFADDSAVSLEDKRRLLELLEKHIGEVKDNEELRNRLADANIVECIDGEFRQPRAVYFPSQKVKAVLGDDVSYANLPEKQEGRSDLCRWLGVRDRLHHHHVQHRIDKLAARPPSPHTRQTIVELLKALGNEWEKLADNEKALFVSLKEMEWLPAEDDQTKLYRPDRLHAIYNKSLFESQAKFLDAPRDIQQSLNRFLEYLGINLRPQPLNVVRHLLQCSSQDVVPPKGIYQWLNNKAQSVHLKELRHAACLRIKDKYLRPNQVFWRENPFGRFRTQLGSNFQSYQALLSALDIRDAPSHDDAIQVLKEVSEEVGTSQLETNDQDVVLQCWVMLTEALEQGEIDGERIRAALQEIKCVPNIQKIVTAAIMDVLRRPSGAYG